MAWGLNVVTRLESLFVICMIIKRRAGRWAQEALISASKIKKLQLAASYLWRASADIHMGGHDGGLEMGTWREQRPRSRKVENA